MTQNDASAAQPKAEPLDQPTSNTATLTARAQPVTIATPPPKEKADASWTGLWPGILPGRERTVLVKEKPGGSATLRASSRAKPKTEPSKSWEKIRWNAGQRRPGSSAAI